MRKHVTSSQYRMPRLIGALNWNDLTDMGRQYFPEFQSVKPMGEYVRNLSTYYKVTTGAVPDHIKNLRKVALGNGYFPAPGQHCIIGIEPSMNNAEIVWAFFHEIGHFLHDHTLKMKKDGSVSARQVRAHEKVANKFAYEEILRRGLVPQRNLEKFKLFYKFIKARDKFARYEGFDGDAVLDAGLEVDVNEMLKKVYKNKSRKLPRF
jgi:hypothetical protein